MESTSSFIFKIASEEWEFEKIHRLNYSTFVEEIPQHQPNPNEILVDPFHLNNTYFICLQGDRLIGMVSVSEMRPFSLDRKFEKIGDTLDAYFPQGLSICEIRLLAVERSHRQGRVLQGVLTMLVRHCKRRRYDIVIISGTVRQLEFYERLGFVPFGPVVGTPEALVVRNL